MLFTNDLRCGFQLHCFGVAAFCKRVGNILKAYDQIVSLFPHKGIGQLGVRKIKSSRQRLRKRDVFQRCVGNDIDNGIENLPQTGGA
ncbi:hypothetical protein D3C75_1211550 [compost metagenome]